MRRIIVSIAASAAGLLFLDACGQKETGSTPKNENGNVEVVTETIETDSNDALSETEETGSTGTVESLNDIRFVCSVWLLMLVQSYSI